MKKTQFFILFCFIQLNVVSQTLVTPNNLIKFWQENEITEVSASVTETLDKLLNKGKLSDLGVFKTLDFFLDCENFYKDISITEYGTEPDYVAAVLKFSTVQIANSSFFSTSSFAVSKSYNMASIKILFDIIQKNDIKFINNQIYLYETLYKMIGRDPYEDGTFLLGGFLFTKDRYFGIYPISDKLSPEKVKEIVLNAHKSIFADKVDYEISKKKYAKESYDLIEKNSDSFLAYLNGWFTNVVPANISGNGLYFSNSGPDTIRNVKLIKHNILDIFNFFHDKTILLGDFNPGSKGIFTSSQLENINANNFDKIEFDLLGEKCNIDFKTKPFTVVMAVKPNVEDLYPNVAPEQTIINIFIYSTKYTESFQVETDFGDGTKEQTNYYTNSGIKYIEIPHLFKDKGWFDITVKIKNSDDRTETSYQNIYLKNPIYINYPIINNSSPFAGELLDVNSEAIVNNGLNVQCEWDFNYDGTFKIESTSNKPSKSLNPDPSLFINSNSVNYKIAVVAKSTFESIEFSDTLIQTVNVRNPIYASFKQNPEADIDGMIYSDSAQAEISFDCSYIQLPDHIPLIFSWDFGDGSIANGFNVNHKFYPGNYNVKLTVSDGTYSNSHTEALNVITLAPPESKIKILQMEYFFDIDPGLGKGIQFMIKASNKISSPFYINLIDQQPGLHRIYFRAKDENGRWSTLYSKPLLVTTESKNAQIDKIKYSIDEEPLAANGNLINVLPSKEVSVSKNLSLAEVSPGLHRIYFKAQDQSGRWSNVYSKPLMVTTEVKSTPISRIEYFIDKKNPGDIGNFLNISPSMDVTVNQNLNLSSISPGLHRLYFKAQDESGRWSAIQSKPILIGNKVNTLPEISRLEYFIDHDPGLLAGKPLTLISGTDITVESNIPLNTTYLGSHTIYFRALDNRGIWSLPQSSTFNIETNKVEFTFQAGWNIISTYVVPANVNLKDIFQAMISTGKLKKVMDEAGKTIENFGIFGGWKNNIGNLLSTEGYKVNMFDTDTLRLEGSLVPLPLDIPLSSGWNIISYPSTSLQDAKALIQSLIDAGKLIKVMDESGRTIENFGIFGGWKNNIGNFVPGKGYKINLNAACTLTIPAIATKAAAVVPEVLASAHFTKAFEGNGTDHMNVSLVDLQTSGLQAGDEIGIFDGKFCVGSATIGMEQLKSGSISIPASANEGSGTELNGFTSGNAIGLQLYRGNQSYKLEVETLAGTQSFEKNGSVFIKVSANDLPVVQVDNNDNLFTVYPNPFTSEITIEVWNSEKTEVDVAIYNLLGQRIKNLYNASNEGQLLLKWDGTNDAGHKMVSGIYLCKVNNETKKVFFKDVK